MGAERASLPARGRGLKQRGHLHRVEGQQSLPARGRGLKRSSAAGPYLR